MKLANLGRAISEGGWRWGMFKRMRKLIARDGSFERHYSGAQETAPQHYFDQIRRMLGAWSEWLPTELATPVGFAETERRAAADPVVAARRPVAGLVTLARTRGAS